MAKANSPEEGMASLIRNLEANTGKSIDAWIATARATGQTKHGQIVAALKKDHGLSHGYANQIALRALAAAASRRRKSIRSTPFTPARRPVFVRFTMHWSRPSRSSAATSSSRRRNLM